MRKRTTRKILLSTIGAGISFALAFSSFARAEEGGFPYMLPEEKPNRKLSAAVERNYTAYLAPRPEDNELKGKYYLYYQAFSGKGGRTEKCLVLVSWADSPDGPWIPTGKIVIPCGGNGEWDQYSIVQITACIGMPVFSTGSALSEEERQETGMMPERWNRA